MIKWKKFLQKFKYLILKSFHLQLFLSLISLPFLMSWGLPISINSPIGNMIFTPILIVFLFLSSLIFFFELFCIPNNLLIFLLDQITYIWNYLLSFGSNSWLITFPVTSNFILILIPLITLIGLQHKKLNSLKANILFFSCILFFFGIYFKINSIHKDEIEYLNLNSKKVIINYKDQKLHLIDNGAFSKSLNPESWIEFTLIPHLIRKYGTNQIESIEIQKLGKRINESIKILIKKTNTQKIVIKDLNKSLNKTQFLELIKEN